MSCIESGVVGIQCCGYITILMIHVCRGQGMEIVSKVLVRPIVLRDACMSVVITSYIIVNLWGFDPLIMMELYSKES